MKRQKMRTEQKSNVKNSVGRLVFVGLSLLFAGFVDFVAVFAVECIFYGNQFML